MCLKSRGTDRRVVLQRDANVGRTIRLKVVPTATSSSAGREALIVRRSIWQQQVRTSRSDRECELLWQHGAC